MTATLLKDTLAKLFSCKFCEISKNTFFTELLWTTALVKLYKCRYIKTFSDLAFSKNELNELFLLILG